MQEPRRLVLATGDSEFGRDPLSEALRSYAQKHDLFQRAWPNATCVAKAGDRQVDSTGASVKFFPLEWDERKTHYVA
jgi:hypothetical protein